MGKSKVGGSNDIYDETINAYNSRKPQEKTAFGESRLAGG
jgi:hypothetical protein